MVDSIMANNMIIRICKSFADIYQYRSMMFSIIQKDLFGRYKNSFFGFGWHFISPIIMMAVYYVVYSSGMRSTSIDDFVIYISSVLFSFSFMTSNLSGGSGYITGSGTMLKKMYFPRELLVISHVISSFIVMIVGYILVFGLIALYGFILNPLSALFVIVIFVLMFFFTLGYVLLFSSLTVYIRDVHYLLSSINIIFMFVTPMYFSVNNLTGPMSNVVWLNPFTYFIEAIHDCIYYRIMPDEKILIVCIIMAAVSMLVGFLVFKKLKHGFVERL